MQHASMTRQKKNIHIQIIEPDDINRRNIRHLLKREGYQTWSAVRGSDALEELRHHNFHILFSNLQTADMGGIELMHQAKRLRPDIEIIFVTDKATVETAVQSMMAGAFSYLPRPFSIKYFFNLVDKALEKTIMRREIRRIHQEIRKDKGIQFIGQSPSIVQLKSEIAEIGQLDCNVLISGETGTGKELVASTIHALSQRADQRFLPINCSALTADLMLNELFGHEKEAFTGASKFRTGLFESANGGIILLDEIGEMPMAMQAKLLRVLQEKKIIRVGGTRQIDIDVRILAATNRDLQEEVKNKNFRQDLYYRINVVSIEIPPLRWRRDDIPLLIKHFLAKYLLPEQHVKYVSPEALDILMNYDYPGNVRELENIIERSLAMCREQEIQPYHLPPELEQPHQSMFIPPIREDLAVTCTLREHEQKYIISVLSRVNGNRTRAAKILGIDRVSLWRKLKRYQQQGIDLADI
jgi:DNA-binding NtrC family response regulator